MPDIISVGIDIGTSTTQVVFSRLSIENTAGQFSVPRVSIVNKSLIYASKVYTTPLMNTYLLDGDGIRTIVENEFTTAGFSPEEMDTGAVIITGESARKENAEMVIQKLSDFAGDFVVATAGPDLESVIAGKGSGAWQHSVDHQCLSVNLDIGGGTTNIAVFDCGDVVAKGCYDIGGRLIRLNKDLTVSSISPAAKKVAEALGLSLRTGQRTDLSALRKLTDRMACLLSQSLGLSPAEPLLDELKSPKSSDLVLPGKTIEALYFSGGVADQIYTDGFPDFVYGDIGVLLGKSVRSSALYKLMPVVKAGETIRATVVGAGTCTTEVSGSTISFSKDIFPIKNVPVLKLTAKEQNQCFDGNADSLRKLVQWFLEQHSSQVLVLAMKGENDPDYCRLRNLASVVFNVLNPVLPAGAPLLLVFEFDIAKAIGITLSAASGGCREIVVLDGIHVDDGDFLDMGRPLMDGLAIPVVVKTLVFG